MASVITWVSPIVSPFEPLVVTLFPLSSTSFRAFGAMATGQMMAHIHNIMWLRPRSFLFICLIIFDLRFKMVAYSDEAPAAACVRLQVSGSDFSLNSIKPSFPQGSELWQQTCRGGVQHWYFRRFATTSHRAGQIRIQLVAKSHGSRMRGASQ